jgi:hypothetical protein
MREFLERREAVLRSQIESTNARLEDIAKSIEADGVVVTGSRGQNVPNRLLRIESELRRDQSRAQNELEHVLVRLDNEKRLEAANRMTSWARQS